jgi:type I restriction enzyme M protein
MADAGEAREMGHFMSQQSLSSFIWSVADLLRGDYKQSDYGKVILPFTVLRRLDCVLEATKDAVLAEYAAKKQAGVSPEPFLLRKAGQTFYNTSPMDMRKLIGDAEQASLDRLDSPQRFLFALARVNARLRQA